MVVGSDEPWPVMIRRGVHDGVGKKQFVHQCPTGRRHCDAARQGRGMALFGKTGDFRRFRFRRFAVDPFLQLELNRGGDEHLRQIVQIWFIAIGQQTVGQPFNPATGVDNAERPASVAVTPITVIVWIGPLQHASR